MGRRKGYKEKRRGKSYAMRAEEVNRIYERWRGTGLSNREIWHRHIYPVYGICERTFYNLRRAYSTGYMTDKFAKTLRKVLRDIQVELTDEFDRNFEREAFFSEAWARRKSPTRPGGHILVDSGTLRRSIRARSRKAASCSRASCPTRPSTTKGAKACWWVLRWRYQMAPSSASGASSWTREPRSRARVCPIPTCMSGESRRASF